jgi:hypothetical protein
MWEALRKDGRCECMKIVPCSLREANAFVSRHHRHHKPARGCKFTVAVANDAGQVCGVAIVGRPVARRLNDGWTVEITRLATDGTRNACSALYAACRRAAFALGYTRVVTYTLPCEGGASLRAAGMKLVGEAGGGSWSRLARPRVDLHPIERKLRWETSVAK